jgi:hypothetical protein
LTTVLYYFEPSKQSAAPSRIVARPSGFGPTTHLLQMKIALLAKHQSTSERPAHYIAAKLIPLLIAHRFAVTVVHGELYQLSTNEPLIETKRRFQRSEPCVKPISVPKLNPSGYDIMTLQSYPEPNRDSSRHPHAAFVRECEEVRKRKENA